MTSTVLLCGFFFQAEDGIRDKLVTGVQTCALPISSGGQVTYANATQTDVARFTDADGFLEAHVLDCQGEAGVEVVKRKKNGRASCRGRGENSVGAASLKKKKKKNRMCIECTRKCIK